MNEHSTPAEEDRAPEGAPTLDPRARSRANRAAAVYGLYRLLLFIVLTAVIQALALLIGAPVPLIMSALLALIVAFPVSMLVFKKQRLEANYAMAQWRRQRNARKDWIRGELAER